MRKAAFLLIVLFAYPAFAELPATRPASPPLTGIIGAMHVEAEMIEEYMPQRSTETIGGVNFVRGTLAGREVVIAESGVGKVNAAMTAALMADRYHPSEVLFTGIAGGIAEDLRPGDIVIAKRTAQHDFGVVTDDGFTPDRVTDPKTGRKTPVFEEADPHLLAIARTVAEHLALVKARSGGNEVMPAIRTGVVVSGDVFVASARRKAELRRDFAADAVEMEGAAVAHVCRSMGVPCLIIRSISDTADLPADIQLPFFLKKAAGNSAVFVNLIVERLAADEPPVIPVGLDAYRMWDHWADQRIGARAYMRSTYDRTGGNEGADASHFLFQLAEDQNVTLDLEGPGMFYFARYNHWHGSPWHYIVDGNDHIVQEESTADPLHPKKDSTFLPADAFPSPLAETWAATKGADLTWVPIPYERSFRMAYSRTRYGTGYYIYDQYVGGAKLSQPLKSWDAAPPSRDVLDLLGRAGSDILPPSDSLEGRLLNLKEQAGTLRLAAHGTSQVVELNEAPAMLRSLSFSVPRGSAMDLSKVRLRITWDGRAAASVDAPLPLFFGAGSLYNRDDREYLVKALPANIRFDKEQIHLACYFPMPFFRSARIDLVGGDVDVPEIHWSARWAPTAAPANHVGYFHATYADHPTPERGKDMVLLDTTKTEGGGDWSGQFIGTSFIFSHDAKLGTLEGDPRFFFDDSNTPQAQGTGTEEWGGGGDYWGGQTMTLPLAGHPTGAPQGKAKDADDAVESAYRFLLADLMPFGKNARIQLEHGGTDESNEHYETVTYWYAIPAASLVLTDELKIADAQSETSHGYVSPDASAPETITSRYELGPDHAAKAEVFAAEPDAGRHTTGQSQFTLKLRPDNLGVLLRRKLDYAFPNQRAEVFVADGAETTEPAATDWKSAGIWYLAGSNTCVYSNPKGELDPAQHKLRTSNRRFRDDEFLVSRELTRGRSAIRVRVKFTPVNVPLFPGQPVAPLAWSELKYSAYCFVMPEFAVGRP